MVFGREGVAIAGYVVWQTTRGSEDEKRRVSMRVFLTSMTIELGVKATKFDEER